MAQYINKAIVMAEIERKYETNLIGAHSAFRNGKIEALREVKDFLNTLEVKEANEALRTEYEKGRHDVIEKTLKWLWDLNQEHEIMSYTDSHVLSSEELQKYYKNNIEE